MQSLKFPSAVICLALPLIFISANAFSQADTISFNGHYYSRISAASVIDMKSFDAENLFKKESTARMNEASVHIKAVRHFRKHYKALPEGIWSGGKNGYTLRFLQGPVLTTLRYTRSGQLIHSLKRYNESSMPTPLRSMVKPVYYDYSIVSVQELAKDLQALPVYYVHVQQGLKYKIVRVYRNEMEEVHSMTLQK